MKRTLFMVLLFVVVALLGVALGVGTRYFVETRSEPTVPIEPVVVSDEPEVIEEPVKIVEPGVCFSNVGLRADFPDTYQTEQRDNGLILVTRDGNESFLMLPVIDEDPRTKYSIPSDPDFITENDLAIPVNIVREDTQTSYFADYEQPFFMILIHGTVDDLSAEADIVEFLSTAYKGVCETE